MVSVPVWLQKVAVWFWRAVVRVAVKPCLPKTHYDYVGPRAIELARAA